MNDESDGSAQPQYLLIHLDVPYFPLIKVCGTSAWKKKEKKDRAGCDKSETGLENLPPGRFSMTDVTDAQGVFSPSSSVRLQLRRTPKCVNNY